MKIGEMLGKTFTNALNFSATGVKLGLVENMQYVSGLLKQRLPNVNKPGSYAKSIFSGETKGNYQASAQVSRTGDSQNYQMIEKYSLLGKEAYKTSSQLNTQTNGPKGQSINLAQQRNTLGNSQLDLSRTVNSNIAITNFASGPKQVRQTSIASQTVSGANRLSNNIANTDTTRIVTNKGANGKITELFSRTQVNENTLVDWKQNLSGQDNRDIVQSTQVSKEQKGKTTITNLSIETKDTRQGVSAINTQQQTDYTAGINYLDKNGDIISSRDIRRVSDYTEDKTINTQQEINTLRDVTTIVNGKENLTLDNTKSTDVLSQLTQAQAQTVTSNLDNAGNVISQATSGSQSVTQLDRTINTDVNRAVVRDAEGVRGAGNLTQETATKIVTDIQYSTGAERQIQRDINTQNEVNWQGAIREEQLEAGAKAFSVSSIDVGKVGTVDITKDGQNISRVNTDTSSSKIVGGDISYKPAEAVAPVQGVVGASIGVSFGTYTGLASSFKLDSGEVDFNLSFASADVTQQETATATTRSGQLNDASLAGKLTSYAGEDGSRIIEINAGYQRTGAKFVSQSGENKEVALAEQDTNVEITGKMVISKNGDVKNIDSEFNVYKLENTGAAGTGEAAVRKSMQQNDPLVNNFSFDKGVFRFNLGFGTLNFAVYA